MMRKLYGWLLSFVRSVTGGILLTLGTIGLVEFVNVRYFPIPRPTSLYMIAVAAAALIGGLRSGLISALLTIAFSAYIVHKPGVAAFQYPTDITARLVLFTLGAPLMAVIVGLLRRRNDDLLRDHIIRAHAENIARAELDRERRIAVTLQNAILSPSQNQSFPGIAVGSCYEPAWSEAEVGGDFYDVFALDPNTVAVVLGDVSGKGLKAAAKTAEVKYTLRAFLHGASRPGKDRWTGVGGEVLGRVNNFLLDHEAVLSHSYQADPADALGPQFGVPVFVCLTLAIIQTDTGEMDITVAAMEPPMIMRRNDYSKLGSATEFLGAGGLPLGVEKDAVYSSSTVHIELGDTLILATDGITEARRPESYDMFGLSGLQLAAETAVAMASASPERLSEASEKIVASAKRFGETGTLKDDACLLIVQRKTQ